MHRAKPGMSASAHFAGFLAGFPEGTGRGFSRSSLIIIAVR
jgi:hypothetical protein